MKVETDAVHSIITIGIAWFRLVHIIILPAITLA